MMGEVEMLVRGESPHHLRLRNRVANLLMLTVLVDLAGTTLIWLLEHDDADTGFTTWAGALFWTTTQLTTVSSQLPNPVTTPGRVIAIALDVWAITVAATLAGSLAAFFRARHVEELDQTTARPRPRA